MSCRSLGLLLRPIVALLFLFSGATVHAFKATQCRPYVEKPIDISLFGYHDSSLKPSRSSQDFLSKELSLFCDSLSSSSNKSVADGGWWGHTESLFLSSTDFKVLCKGTPDEFDSFLDVLFNTQMTFGFGQGPGTKMDVSVFADAVGDTYIDSFYRLVESLGRQSVYSPEHYGFSWNVSRGRMFRMFRSVEQTLHLKLKSPVVGGGIFGLDFHSAGVFNPRQFSALNLAVRIQKIALQHGDLSAFRVCEIGGGAGYVAYFARKLGLLTYSIYDITAAGMTQFLVLGAEFGTAVRFGNPEPNFISLIHVYMNPLNSFEGCSLIVNADSFPEMPDFVALEYFRKMAASSTVKYFLSENQESRVLTGTGDGRLLPKQNDVRKLAMGNGFASTSRYLSWMRMGYVEELFTKLHAVV